MITTISTKNNLATKDCDCQYESKEKENGKKNGKKK